MSAQDKFENKGEELKGRAKQAAGAATDDDSLQNEGQADQTSSALKKGAEKLKDKANEAVEKLLGDD